MSSSFSIGVMKIMSTPISVVSAIQPRTRYSRVGLLIPRVRRTGRACISPTVRVAWIFTEDGLRFICSGNFLFVLSLYKISKKKERKKGKCKQDNLIFDYLKKCVNFCFPIPPYHWAVKCNISFIFTLTICTFIKVYLEGKHW